METKTGIACIWKKIMAILKKIWREIARDCNYPAVPVCRRNNTPSISRYNMIYCNNGEQQIRLGNKTRISRRPERASVSSFQRFEVLLLKSLYVLISCKNVENWWRYESIFCTTLKPRPNIVISLEMVTWPEGIILAYGGRVDQRSHDIVSSNEDGHSTY
jgi:hypothetical protein